MGGYMRRQNKSSKIQIPNVLIQLIRDNISYIFIRFSNALLNPQNMELINDVKVKLIQSGGKFKYGASALIDFPIDIRFKEQVSWKIRLHKEGGDLSNYHYFIGIVSNHCQNFADSAHAGLKHSYGILGGRNGVLKNGHSGTDVAYNNEFRNDEIICVEYDGEKKQLIFSKEKNEQQISMHSVDLPTRVKDAVITHWYPTISLRDVNDTAEII